ncbi:polysaccharide deacetylase [Bacteroidota bacterium]|nr:polysaccharide deacetylase [Bacteroidota bacterium]
MYFIKTPQLLKRLYPSQVWSLPDDKKTIYLTFDDGPTPGITEWTLDTLAKHNARATFFLVGDNIVRYPGMVKSITASGHHVGNHTQNHLNGWNTETKDYLRNTLKCAEVLNTPLFRPPYGRITRAQARIMQKRFKIIMWDVLSGDFDKTISKERVLRNVLDHTGNGSIIVFHDSLKAESRMRYALPRVLDYFGDKGFSFDAIPYS